jgi:hypothetical protein
MSTARLKRCTYAGSVLLVCVACTDAAVTSPRPVATDVTLAVADPGTELANYMDALNVQLAAQGAGYRATMAEYVTSPDSGQAGGTVLAKTVGNKHLAFDFVPFDPRRTWSGAATGSADDITEAIDETGDAVPVFGGLTAAQTTAAILAAAGTWQGVSCSTLPLSLNPTLALDVGVVAFLNGLGGSPFVFADVQHAGWRDINFAGGILGVTFTFIFVDDDGNPTDIDNNNYGDAAFREIYYDPSFTWRNDGGNIDVETVSLHEQGHGLSQNHFGTVRLTNDGSLQASPRAVMNALYAGPLRELQGSDSGGHCSNWAAWPNQ